MKRIIYLLPILLLLFGAFSIYQYVQYQQELDALKVAYRQAPEDMPTDIFGAEKPPAETYYEHHKNMSSIARYNPLLSSTIKRKLYFYDFSKHNEILGDFHSLLLHRNSLLLAQTDDPIEYKLIEKKIQDNSEQMCTIWGDFLQHMQQTYPNIPEAMEFNNLCATNMIKDYTPSQILESIVLPTIDYSISSKPQ